MPDERRAIQPTPERPFGPVTYIPSFVEGGWYDSKMPGTFELSEAQHAITDILTSTSLVPQTVQQMGGNPTTDEPTIVTLYQSGLKNAVYGVMTGMDAQYIVMMSRGGSTLNHETDTDFANLLDTHSRLKNAGIMPFIPQVYARAHNEKATAFSVEFIPDHTELNCFPGELEGKTSTFFRMNDLTDLAAFHNAATAMQARKALSGDEVATDHLRRVNNSIKRELITKLTLLYKATHRVPAEFSVNAGDFIVRLGQKGGWDARLITIRGGLQELPDDVFPIWLSALGEASPLGDYHLFDGNQELIREGIEDAEKIFAEAKSHQT